MVLAATSLDCVRGGRLVFEGVNFDLGPGQVMILEGPNGSGKTSLLRLVAGFIRPAGGGLTWDGAPVTDDTEAFRGRLRFVGHLDAVKPVFTVSENLAFWAGLQGGDDDGGRVETALERFGLSGLSDLPAEFLSAGQRRRLNLARLAASPGKLWLLDEPTVALDAESTGGVSKLLAEHAAAGGMALIATHIDVGVPGARRLALPEGRLS